MCVKPLCKEGKIRLSILQETCTDTNHIKLNDTSFVMHNTAFISEKKYYRRIVGHLDASSLIHLLTCFRLWWENGQVSNSPNLQGSCKLTFPFQALSTDDPTLLCTNTVRPITDGWFWGEAFPWRAAFFPTWTHRTSRAERTSHWLTFHSLPAQHGQVNPTRLPFFILPFPFVYILNWKVILPAPPQKKF